MFLSVISVSKTFLRHNTPNPRTGGGDPQDPPARPWILDFNMLRPPTYIACLRVCERIQCFGRSHGRILEELFVLVALIDPVIFVSWSTRQPYWIMSITPIISACCCWWCDDNDAVMCGCRSFIMADRMLQIERVQISDEGVYVCRVENSVGWREAEATLVVHCTNQ